METYSHCILVCSDYASRTRNGLHFLFNDANATDIVDITKKYTEKEGVSMYIVVTDQVSIESVQKKDSFFKNIKIVEGFDSKNLLDFDRFLANRVGVLDFAMLLLSRDSLRIKDLKTYLHLCYIIYSNKYNSLPFQDKFYIRNEFVGFKRIEEYFGKYDNMAIIRCSKPDVIISKFFNSEDGTFLMNNLLNIYYKIRKFSIEHLRTDLLTFLESIKQKYRKPFRKNELYLTKKRIKDYYDKLSSEIQELKGNDTGIIN